MRRSGQCTLSTILHVHVVVIVTVPVALKGPSAAILELLGDLSPVPIVGHPVNGWSTIGSIHLKDVEAGSQSERAHGEGLPEADPLDDATVLVDDFTLFEVQGGIWAH